MRAYTKKSSWHTAIAILGLTILTTACATAPTPQEKFDPLRAPWTAIQQASSGKTVNLYMWGGSAPINTYIDQWAAPRLKAQENIMLRRVPVTDTVEIMNKLLAEKAENRATGTVDIMWINGANFRTAKTKELLLGRFADQLPHVQQYVDTTAPDVAYDFGLATDGYEAPWGKAQFVFIYDSSKIASPPKSIAELRAWAQKNPGKFAYPAPPDFNGSAFVRHVLYEVAGGHAPFLDETLTEMQWLDKAAPVWQWLNALEPYLWREGKTYPENIAKLDQLFASGEVWMSMGYDPARAANLVKSNTFPATTRTFVLDKGTLANTHYLAIPFNAPQPAAAMATINFLLSPDAQIAKFDPLHWGEDMALDPLKLSEDQRKQLQKIDRGAATLPADVLATHRLPEMPAARVTVLEQRWQDEVARK
jgi:putative spermidine/putrescine transport system substrate-binding protein